MWIFMRDSFLSIVQHDDDGRFLQVRSRIRGDIEQMFPEAVVAEDDRSDYRFMANINRDRVAHAVALRIQQLDYTSLNESVSDTPRAIPYDKVYSAMLDEQVLQYGSELDPLPIYVSSYELESDSRVPDAAYDAAG